MTGDSGQPPLSDTSRFEAANRRFDAANSLNLKKNFPQDPDSRVLEDALCLVFLEFQFAELAAKTTDDKMINALQKAWKKMTPAAREQALKLHYGPTEKSLIDRALAQTSVR